ncbi:serine hydrolase domain-containing protein [Longispora sp. K20-0274]|uniref:serine hydrolase domain-containing protein n=1 Tax=Longispora sp. K20-0274 TaxID=3088255 RepID=UPI00399AA971
MRRRALIGAAVVAAMALTASPAFADACDPVVGPPNAAALEAAIAGLPNPDVTGALVRVTGSAGRWTGTSGVSDRSTGAPVDPDGHIRIGSTTKVFTAVLVLRLAQEHRIDLARPVQHYLPGLLPDSYPPIPVRTLLDHTSGLPSVDIPGMYDPAWVVAHRYDHWTPQQVIATATAHPVVFAPGTAQMYTNTSYLVAGLLAEKVTGVTYAQLVRDLITRPLGLRDTYEPGDDPRLPAPHSNGYLAVGGQLVDVTSMNQSMTWSAGSLVSTARDLDTFLSALFRGRLLGREMTAALFTVPDVSLVEGGPAIYSQGLMRLVVNGTTVWGKTGSRYGYASGVFATRNLERVVAYSVNATTKKSDGQPAIVLRIADAASR